MDTVNTVVNTDSKKSISWLELIPKLLAVFAPLGIALYFLFSIYTRINENTDKQKAIDKRIDELVLELHSKADKHEVKDLDDKVSRQYSIFNERMLRDVDPMKTWVDFHKGYIEGSKSKQ